MIHQPLTQPTSCKLPGKASLQVPSARLLFIYLIVHTWFSDLFQNVHEAFDIHDKIHSKVSEEYITLTYKSMESF